MRGDIVKLDFLKKKDETTGVEVIQLSDNIGDTYHSYFTMPLVSKDNSYILVADNRTGSWQLYIIYFKEKRMVQITEGDNVFVHGALLDRAKDRVYFVQNNMLKSVDVATFKEQDHLHIPKGFRTSQLSITNDGSYIAFTYTEELELCDTEKVASKPGVGLLGREKFYRHPQSVVIRYNTVEQKYQAVWGENQWISHTNISPIDSDTILFCHETSWFLVQRMWICKVQTDTVYPLIKQQYNLDRVGHEFFTASGRIGAQYSYRHSPELPFYLHGDIFVNVDGTKEERFFYPYTRPEHIQLNYGENMGVGDNAHIREVQPDKRDYISLLKYDNFKVKVGLLCKHGTSWAGQHTHPHPFFTPDDKYVIYSSQINGRCNIYMAEANWDKCIYSD